MQDNPSALITGPNELKFVNEPVAAAPGAGEVLVKTRYSLISPGTELAIFQHTHVGFSDPANGFAKYPFRPGYAAVGQISAVGAGVSGFAEGAWVFLKGRHQSHAMIDVAKEILLPLPEKIDPKLAAFARLAQIAASALEVSRAGRGDTVAVLGLGLVGNLAAQLFQMKGCRVIGVDLIPSRCEIAERCWVRALPVTAPEVVAQCRAAFAEAGAATVVEATGHPLAVATALQMTARGGETILLGATRGKVELDVYKLIFAPYVTVRGAHECVLNKEGRVQELIRQSLDDIAVGRLNVAPLLSQVVDYRDLEAAYRRLSDHLHDTLAIELQWPE